MTLVRVRPLAEVDLVERARYYRDEGGADLAERFVDAALSSLRAIGRMPGAGSPRVGELCSIPGLRMRRVPGFPCGWYYLVGADLVDVVRLLDDARDLGALVGDLGTE